MKATGKTDSEAAERKRIKREIQAVTTKRKMFETEFGLVVPGSLEDRKIKDCNKQLKELNTQLAAL